MNHIKELYTIMEKSRTEAEQIIKRAREAEDNFSSDRDGVYLSEEVANPIGDIYFGENLQVMERLLAKGYAGKVNCIYMDPPFFTKTDYDATIKVGDINVSHKAYTDRWKGGLMEFLSMLAVRLYVAKEFLTDDGLIWLHLDWHAVHYAKMLMDCIFDEKHMVNEIIWTYKSGGAGKKHFSRKHDTLLLYSKQDKYAFYPIKEKSYNRQFKPYHFKGVEEFKDDVGWYTMVNMKDVWSIDMVGRTAQERTGYATQKPEKLLERIVESSTKVGDLCADFFCGSGTLPVVAGKMGRKFIACDGGALAVAQTSVRLQEAGIGYKTYDLGDNEKCICENKTSPLVSLIPIDEERSQILLKGLSVQDYSFINDKDMMASVEKVVKEQPLNLIYAWSVDLAYDGNVHRPDVCYYRGKSGIDFCWEGKISAGSRIHVKITDIFGNSGYAEL